MGSAAAEADVAGRALGAAATEALAFAGLGGTRERLACPGWPGERTRRVTKFAAGAYGAGLTADRAVC
jgi:hypothetical protein